MKRALVISGALAAVVVSSACGNSTYPVVSDGPDGGSSGTDAAVCKPTEAKESNCGDGIDSDCNGQIDCLDPACDGQTCVSGAGYQCTAGGCVTPGDMPTLPPVTGVHLTVRGDTAIVDFDPVEGALDYRIYAYPKKEDILVGKAGELSVKNAIYRCSGDVPLQSREKDPASGFKVSLGHETSTGDVSLAGYRRTEAESILGYVFQTPADGRTAVYRVADPNRKGGYTNGDWAVVPGNDFNAADYVLGTAARDAAVAKGMRDDGIAFYVSDAGTQPIYFERYDDKVYASPTVLYTDGPEHDYRSKNDKPADIADAGLRFKVLATQEAGSVPLHRVLYGSFDVLAAGEERFQRVLHQGNRPMTSVTWTGVTAQTTFVVEALDAGCPFPGGYIGGTHAPADTDPSSHPSITLDEARLPGSGEVFWNGQHDPNNRPKPIARAFVDVKPAAPPKMDFYESFGPSTPWVQPPEVASDGSAGLLQIYENDRWFIDIGGTTNKSFGPVLGELQIGCTDWGSACGIGIHPRGIDWKIASGTFIHARMTVEVPSTLRRYPGIVITTTPFLEVGTPGYKPYDIPVGNRLGPLEAEGSGPYSTLLVQPVSNDLELQFCDRRGWGVGAQCKRANTHGPLTHWVNNKQPWLPEPVLGELFGFDRPVQFDVYASTDRVYLFIDDKPAGCGIIPAGRLSPGPVQVYFHAVGYHLGIDDPSDPNTPNQYLRNYSFLRTDRRFDELGISQGVAAPGWDEARFPCGTEWGP